MAFFLSVLLFAAPDHTEQLQFKAALMNELVARVPELLVGFDPASGRFISGRAWDQRIQRRTYLLAVAYSTHLKSNPHYRDPKLLEIIIKAGNSLIDAQDDRGRWLYTKSDGSTWEWRWQEWTYSRWVDTFEMIRGDTPPTDRERWRRALMLGFQHMDRYLLDRTASERVDNHRVEMAAGVFAAGQVLNNAAWREHAAAYMAIVVDQQSPNGYWSEGGGPVILYNFEYVGSLGRYYARSRDQRVLEALDRAAWFHYRFTYPDGHAVETLDQRNPFSGAINHAWEAFSLTPVGRAYLKRRIMAASP